MTTAFVLSGGGSLGAVQVGMLQALSERGVQPDLLVGTSAGAINAAFVAGHGMSSEALQSAPGRNQPGISGDTRLPHRAARDHHRPA